MWPKRACLVLLAAAGWPAAAVPAERIARGAAAQACLRHGPGFVEVPGTSTCIRISGRAQAGAAASTRRVTRDDVPSFRSGGRVAVDTRTDTAYGPVRGYVRMRAGPDTRP